MPAGSMRNQPLGGENPCTVRFIPQRTARRPLDSTVAVGFNTRRFPAGISPALLRGAHMMKKLLLALCAFSFLAAVQAKAEDKPAPDKKEAKKGKKKGKKKKDADKPADAPK
jgi:hypothetical protein